MELEGYSRPTYNKLAHSATTRSTVVGVIHKLTADEFVDNISFFHLFTGQLLAHFVPCCGLPDCCKLHIVHIALVF